MNSFYLAARLSKQAFHQYVERRFSQREECEQLLPVIAQIRKEYPTMSAREMYRIIQPVGMGRDKFEQFCFEEGFKVERHRAFHRTTDSFGVTRFPNLVKGRELTAVNQVWVSDITYYRIADRFYYLTFITDLFSRRILGYSVARDMFTESTTIPALQMALNNRNGHKPAIFHSDGGGQYYSKEFRRLTGSEIANSMGVSAYDNPHAERVNGLIKNDYLIHYNPRTFEQLQIQTARAVNNYNLKRHSSLTTAPLLFETLSTNPQILTKEKKDQKKKKSQQLNKFTNLPEKVNLIQA